jgi:hypothetical protein
MRYAPEQDAEFARLRSLQATWRVVIVNRWCRSRQSGDILPEMTGTGAYPMAEESVTQAANSVSDQAAGAAGARSDESGARGALQGAIRKVMEEIEHHEKQARQHLAQAAELRKALRESISFLHEQGEKKTPIAVPRVSRADKTGGSAADDKEKPSASSNKHPRSKKK